MRSETFSTPGPVRLDLELPAGAIEIDASEADETHVQLEALSANEQVQEMVAAARIESTRRGDGYEVTVHVRTRHGVWISFSSGPDIRLGTPEMRLRISCPSRAELDVRTKSADLEAHGEYGRVDFKTASGDMSVDTARDVDVKTASGDVHFERVEGRLDAKTVSGEVEVRDQHGDFTGDTVSGSLTVQAAELRHLRTKSVSGSVAVDVGTAPSTIGVSTVSGDVTIRIPADSGFDLNARSVSGRVVAGGERLAEKPGKNGGRLSRGDGAVQLVAKTVSGDVTLLHAQPSSPETAGWTA